MKQGFSTSGEPLSRQCEEIRGDPSRGLYRHHCEQLPDTKYKEWRVLEAWVQEYVQYFPWTTKEAYKAFGLKV